ncbi:C40 family peptidase [Flavobacterium agricola]|uniref:C40 family peptidase n=1 Tax=Flavobacterium agricola TaxID=2870839 RepID=A0ABY6M0Y9_9FLAO|nr:C40 family peptidase [Flavobacterium agricola]UYW01329.1 C40 family peptidase [Flavobacterium agricola]
MKRFLFIALVGAVMVSCKSNSGIVTSKSEAKRKGMYSKVSSTQSTNTMEAVTFKKPAVKPVGTIENTTSEIILSENNAKANTTASVFTVDVINEAKNYLGVRYKFAGTTRSGMDCSGLVTTVFKEFDFSLPRSSRDMAKVGTVVTKKNIAPGDLVFFKTNGRSVINHVGIVVDVIGDEFKFIHSSTSRGVIISSNTEPYYKKSFAQANRVF